MAGSVNDVDALRLIFEKLENTLFLALIPETGRRGRRNRNSPFSFLFHPIGHRVAVIHVAYPVNHPCIKQDPLRQSRLTSVNMRADTNVPRTFQGVSSIGRIGVGRHSTRLLYL
jgi:hypothetical protein